MKKQEKRMPLYLEEKILRDVSFEKLPAKWQDFDFSRFLKDKTLVDFQQDALKNALTILADYNERTEDLPVCKNEQEKKKQFFWRYYENEIGDKLDYDLKKKREGKTAKYLLEYDKNYRVEDNKISFAYFINRMSFWMATGSGNT